jgi:hypothetical protein
MIEFCAPPTESFPFLQKREILMADLLELSWRSDFDTIQATGWQYPDVFASVES